MIMSRRSAVAAIALAAVTATGAFAPATAAEFTARIGHLESPLQARHKALERVAALVKERTGGAVEFKLFPLSQLGGARQMNEGTQLGTIEGTVSPAAFLGGFNPAISILDIPFLDLPDTLNICDGIREVLRVDDEGIYLVYWSTGDSLVNHISIDNSYDAYGVTVNNRGCVNSDVTIITRDCPAYLPNTFTPNGDGVNDRFGPLQYNIESISTTYS